MKKLGSWAKEYDVVDALDTDIACKYNQESPWTRDMDWMDKEQLFTSCHFVMGDWGEQITEAVTEGLRDDLSW